MARPLNKKYFGNVYPGGAGGEGLASVTLGGTNNSTTYVNNAALTISAPSIQNGVQATGTVQTYAAGALTNASGAFSPIANASPW